MRTVSLGLVVLSLVACSREDSGKIGPDVTVADAGPQAEDATTPVVPAADTAVSGSRLKRRLAKGADGSQQLFGWYDSLRNEECSVSLHADNTHRCLPTAAAVTYKAEATCTKDVALRPAASLPAPKYAAITLNDATRRFTILGPHTGTLYAMQGAICNGFTPPSGFDFYDVGDEVPGSEFVQMTIVTD